MQYKNNFYSPRLVGSKPFLSCDVKPLEYRGYLIFERIKGSGFDIVKDGECVAMRAGLNGAKKVIDELLNKDQ